MRKIKAGALQFVLFVGAIVAVLLMAFVLISYTQVLFKKKADVTVELVQAAQEGLDASFTAEFTEGESVEHNISKSTDITVSVTKSYWGLLEIRNAAAKKGALEFNKLGFVGKTILERPVLYLKENQRPMVIAGDARIRGDVQLPKRGIKRGNIRGQGYSGSQLVYGKQTRSTESLPLLDNAIQKQLDLYAQNRLEAQGKSIRLKRGLILAQSFEDPIKIINGSEVNLEDVKLSGHILVRASHKIVVSTTSQLHDVVLMAPKIEIKDNVTGNFQAIASQEIRVGKGCLLEYPSVLVISETVAANESRNPNLIIARRSEVRGSVIYQSNLEPIRTKANIYIGEDAVVLGEVMCSGNLEVKGKIHGSASTDAFVAMENGNAYQNYLFNGRLDGTALPLAYAGFSYSGEKPNQIMKWLY
ncbi:hypothetical protein M3P19_15640 [Muricauda sp. 2012CJ35-5]|uniref:Polymer-forming cytoskeletal protein n=1 Tax=Flagellimonas spongiicola TaxID=2942208 RepID=A0ABT0PVM8_9FLAO|nr:hypothetical protein [Allomuricauda spongiicola]MCL6275447.1 hypothetical protein [Allomuricauda spongiicola]